MVSRNSDRAVPAPKLETKFFGDAAEAVAYAQKIYLANTEYLQENFRLIAREDKTPSEVSANYPYVAVNIRRQDLHTDTIDTRASHGFVTRPGRHVTTITRPDIFGDYYREQLRLLHQNHHVPIEVGMSSSAIPLQFAFGKNDQLRSRLSHAQIEQVRRTFDSPDLERMGDDFPAPGNKCFPLSLFTAPRVDLSLLRLRHYTGTDAGDFQRFVLFTNYDFYVRDFRDYARKIFKRTGNEQEHAYRRSYTRFVEPGGYTTYNANISERKPTGRRQSRTPQMPAYHLVREDGNGITLVNIGVGPANAKNITDHIAVLRPHAWIMVGHCAGLSPTLEKGGFVLGHAYLRKDHVLDDKLPLHIPVPSLSEVQLALSGAVKKVTGRTGADLDKALRTGTIATFDDRNWEFDGFNRHQAELEQSNTVAIDMESGTIAANGYRYRVPYGTLLCVSDRPLLGDLKLPGMASEFYAQQTSAHLQVAIAAMETLREDPRFLHSRKMTPHVGRPFL